MTRSHFILLALTVAALCLPTPAKSSAVAAQLAVARGGVVKDPKEAAKKKEEGEEEEAADEEEAAGDDEAEADPEVKKAEEEAEAVAKEAEHVSNAEEAALSAKKAARAAGVAAAVADRIAVHSAVVQRKAKKALKLAHEALHGATESAEMLSEAQRAKLAQAERHLKAAAREASFGRVRGVTAVPADEDKSLKEMRGELASLRKSLCDARAQQGGSAEEKESLDDVESQIQELEGMLSELEKEEKVKRAADAALKHKEIQEEIDELAEAVHRLRKQMALSGHSVHTVTFKAAKAPVKHHPAGNHSAAAGPVMPFQGLEPFGREDTAQELTEDSVSQSDAMVDQIEKAEEAEEKRAVFRALTRLRGAAIASFDGIAKAHTANIDTYAAEHQWRKSHPVRHLAEEEGDVAKWAFPSDADF